MDTDGNATIIPNRNIAISICVPFDYGSKNMKIKTMKTFDRLQNIAQSFSLATIVISAAIVFPLIAQTQPPTKKIRWKPPIPPSSLGIPGNRAQGGGTRGCRPYRGIAALVPLSPQKIAWGRTIDNRPTVWLNAPQGLTKDLSIEIAVREDNGKSIAKHLFTTKNNISPGAIGVTFPSGTVLKIDRIYRWEVAFYCDSEERVDRPLLIQGQIQRIATPTAIATAKSSLEVAQILAGNGIWYDALTQIGNPLRNKKDPDLANAWSELLRSAGISGSNSIQDCCQFDSAITQHSTSPKTFFKLD
jgi:hypothetical protein